ncbi:MAG: histidine phosphatase family protein [Chloroflexota bacterium]
MLRLVLVRHGETDWTRQGRFHGLTDVELSVAGRQQAECAALALRSMPIAAVYSSPLRRALVTGSVIASCCCVIIETDHGLVELDEGVLDGLTYLEMKTRYASFLAEWKRDAANARLPGGECLWALQERAWASVQRMMARHTCGNVVIVSHYFALCSIICKSLDIDLALFRKLRLDAGSISILGFSGRKCVLELLNDTCHFALCNV